MECWNVVLRILWTWLRWEEPLSLAVSLWDACVDFFQLVRNSHFISFILLCVFSSIRFLLLFFFFYTGSSIKHYFEVPRVACITGEKPNIPNPYPHLMDCLLTACSTSTTYFECYIMQQMWCQALEYVGNRTTVLLQGQCLLSNGYRLWGKTFSQCCQ